MGDEVQTGRVASFLDKAAAAVVLVLGDFIFGRLLRYQLTDLGTVALTIIGICGDIAERIGFRQQAVKPIVSVGRRMIIGIYSLSAQTNRVVLITGDMAFGIGDFRKMKNVLVF